MGGLDKAEDRRLQCLVFLVLKIVLLGSVLLSCSVNESFKGTEFKPPKVAPDFELTDQFGQSVRLSDFRGTVVVLTFLYTNCSNVCPLIVNQIKEIQEILDKDSVVKFVAVTVDPQNDTVERVYNYSSELGMLHNWSFLVGGAERLEEIWQQYFVHPIEVDTSVRTPNSKGLSKFKDDILGRKIIHTTPLFLIDAEGLMRTVVTPAFDTDAVVHDIRLLLSH